MTNNINVAEDFSQFPAGRFKSDGAFSGEKFREEFLIPATQSENKTVIVLDGTKGYGSSFLEEAFGGLIRSGAIDAENFKNKFSLKSEDLSLIADIKLYVKEAHKKKN
eukprot:NODE_7987_length_539_cov_2.948980_g6940_i0.p1 GENE.NODE_7987_length_539_cov_2.948980_g6940_i0~~NODE_7987_length_539_cov_2.948980_g6940_i0.p1  ORF type:complete len:108 (-),score=4.85 NODE_7987_length_539_cov_2.948980_g6940_i0:93-416(-)